MRSVVEKVFVYQSLTHDCSRSNSRSSSPLNATRIHTCSKVGLFLQISLWIQIIHFNFSRVPRSIIFLLLFRIKSSFVNTLYAVFRIHSHIFNQMNAFFLITHEFQCNCQVKCFRTYEILFKFFIYLSINIQNCFKHCLTEKNIVNDRVYSSYSNNQQSETLCHDDESEKSVKDEQWFALLRVLISKIKYMDNVIWLQRKENN